MGASLPSWLTLGAAGGLLQSDGTNPAWLGIGTAGQAMRSDGANPAWEGMRGARVKRASGQSISNALYTAVSWDTEDFDTASFWALGSPTRFVAPRTGYYLVGGKIGWDANSANVRELKIYVNGASADDYTESIQALSGIATRMNICFPMHLTASDYVELYVWQNSGGALSHGNDYSYFWILDVGP